MGEDGGGGGRWLDEGGGGVGGVICQGRMEQGVKALLRK